jgi:hypothetical protein
MCNQLKHECDPQLSRALRAGCYRRCIRPTGIVTDFSGIRIRLHIIGVIIILWSM